MLFIGSFVEGEYANSGFITGSSGERIYFYYHNLEHLEKELKNNSFETIDLLHKKYKKTDGIEETHTAIILKQLAK